MVIKQVPDPYLGPKEVRLLLVFRGVSGFFVLFGVYYSLQYLSLSDATVITFLSPLSTAFAGYMLLGEQFSYHQALAGAFSFIGVVLIARPQALFGARLSETDGLTVHEWLDVPIVPPEQRLAAVGVALIGVLGATGVYTSLRAIGKRAHTLHSLTAFASQCVIVSGIGMFALGIPPVLPSNPMWLFLLILICIFGFLAQVFLTMGLQRETAGRGTLAFYVQIVFATILERIFFHTSPSPLSLLGTFVILGSALYVALTKGPAPSSTIKPDTSPSEDIYLEDGLILHDEL